MSDTPTDGAIRAEAERRYPVRLPYNAAFERAMTNRDAFFAGAQWAREQTAERVTDMFQPPTYEERYGQTAPTVAQFIEKWESVGPPGGDTHDAYSIGWCNARNAVLHDVRGIAPTVVPSVDAIARAAGSVIYSGTDHGLSTATKIAEAVAAADPRRSEAAVFREGYNEGYRDRAAERDYDPDARLREGSGQ